MPILEWDNSYRVNIKEIDEQHQKLVGLLNCLADAMESGQGSQVVEKTLFEMIDYAVVHFESEESLFDNFDYPKSSQHKAEHQEFVAKTKELKRSFQKGSITITSEVLSFLGDWVRNHIRVSDQGYSRFLNNRGVF